MRAGRAKAGRAGVRVLMLALAACLVCLPAVAGPGEAAEPAVELDYANPGLIPAHWVMTIHPDGSGHFKSERGNAPVSPSEGFQPADVDRDIHLSAAFADRVFAAAHRQKNFAFDCDSHSKIAFQGWKTLRYAGPDGAGSCRFNYSKDKEIQELGESLVAVGGTILEGARLEVLLQHDRLGLDKEMDYLVEAAGDGRLQQIAVIHGILERLANDPAVMDRVRKRARILMTSAG